jgi:hypothetical protein
MDKAKIGELHTKAAMVALNYTVQLLVWSEDKLGVFQPLGSGVLMTIAGRYYLITAGHCLKQNGLDVKVGILNGAGHMELIRGVTAVNQGNDNKIDVGIIKLSDKSIAAIQQNHSFLTAANVMLNEGISHESVYLALGYPLTKTYINHKRKKIRREPLVYTVVSKSAEFYDKLCYKQSSNIILGFNQRRSQFYDTDEMNMSPDPKGVSGGGLWFIQQSNSGAIEYNLCGILIEHYKTYNVIIATKTEEFVALMRGLEGFDANSGGKLAS